MSNALADSPGSIAPTTDGSAALPSLGDALFRISAATAAWFVLISLGAAALVHAVWRPSRFREIRLWLPLSHGVGPRAPGFRGCRADLRNHRHIRHRDAHCGPDQLRYRRLFERGMPYLSCVAPVASAIELLAGIPSIIYGMWGLFVFVPFMSDHIEPWLTDHLGPLPLIGFLFDGPPLGIGMLTAGIILAVMVLPFISSVMRDVFALVPPQLAGSRLWPRRDTLGGRARCGPALHTHGCCRRHLPRPWPRARGNHGRDLCSRQRASGQRVIA